MSTPKPIPKRRLKKKYRYSLILFIILLIGLYFYSNLSKITSIEVINQGHLTTFEIRDLAKVNEHDIQLLTFDFFVKKELEKHPLIDRAHVENIFFGKMRIKVFERNVYGFYIDHDEVIFVSDGGQTFKIEEDDLRLRLKASVPKIVLPLDAEGNVNTSILPDLIIVLAQINEDSLSQISEIEYSYDVAGNDFVVTMTHPRQIRFVTKLDYLVNAMRYYYELADQISGTNICIYMFSETKAIPQKCK